MSEIRQDFTLQSFPHVTVQRINEAFLRWRIFTRVTVKWAGYGEHVLSFS